MSSTLEFVKTLYKTPALVCHGVRCGKPNCRCATGDLHGPYHFLMWRQGGKQRRHYVRQAEVEAVRVVIEDRRRHDRDKRWMLTLALGDLREMRRWLRDLETG